MALRLTSPAFAHERAIPSRYTADGEGVSPALVWTDPPRGTRSFALIVDDPDAPRGTWVHWVLYELPANVRSLPEGATLAALPAGTVEGRNDWNEPGWRGPDPPAGHHHRYYFKLYALDTSLDELGGGASKGDLENAMMGHILSLATLMGTYETRRR